MPMFYLPKHALRAMFSQLLPTAEHTCFVIAHVSQPFFFFVCGVWVLFTKKERQTQTTKNERKAP